MAIKFEDGAKAGERLLRAAEEAGAIARGGADPARVYVPSEKRGYDRNAAHREYMRGYMRARRAAARAKQGE
jgi:hypothetical protein